MVSAFKHHWPEYLIEAAGLGLFMVSACVFTVLLFYPNSALVTGISSVMLRQILMGVAMGLTAWGLIASPWGKRSGAHYNPSVTITFFRLGKVPGWDAVNYILFQFIGGLMGMLLVRALMPAAMADPSVFFAVTKPANGIAASFIAEILISFGLMMTVLIVSNNARLAKYTPVFAACLVGLYITFEAPISGMSMNPARTFASALPANYWKDIWIYFTAPPLGMLSASQVFLWAGGRSNLGGLM